MLFRLFTVLAVLVLAVSTWYLSSPRRADSTRTRDAQAQRPGYFLKNAVMTEFAADGTPSLRIAAERIDQVPRSTEVNLYDIRVDYQSPNGTAWVVVGDTARVQPGGNVVDVAGNVRLQGTDPQREGTPVIRTDTLTYDVQNSIASTKSDVRIEFLQHTLTARGLVANLKDRSVRLESKVNGRFHP